MKIVLNRDVKNVGKVGEICTVKDGYGRNFLIPKGYAVIANKYNVAKLQEKLEALKQKNDELSLIAKEVANCLSKKVFNIVRQAADDGTIYGSVKNRDVRSLVCELIHENRISFSIDVGSIKIESPIKSLGQYLITIELFSDVSVKIRLNICRTAMDFDESIESFDKKYTQFVVNSSNQNNKTQENKQEQTANNVELKEDAKNGNNEPNEQQKNKKTKQAVDKNLEKEDNGKK